MTDARFPERWLNDRRLARTSDAEFRAFVLALAWSVSNRTDGVVTAEDLELIPRADLGHAEALADRGLWEAVEGGWRIVEFGSTQTPSAQLEGLAARRAGDAKRAKKYRDGKRASSRDSSRDDIGQARTGQDRPDALPASAGNSIGGEDHHQSSSHVTRATTPVDNREPTW